MSNFNKDLLDRFIQGYVECAFWASNDESDPETGGDPLDKNYTLEDLSDDAMDKLEKDCELFCEQNAQDLRDTYVFMTYAGHDFWLTRNGHGSGFWDGDYEQGIGERLSESSEKFGECHLYVSDDGKIEIM